MAARALDVALLGLALLDERGEQRPDVARADRAAARVLVAGVRIGPARRARAAGARLE